VLGLIARGLTNKEMAHSLGITERGAAAHVSRLLARFRVPNRAGLIARTLSNTVGGAADDPIEHLRRTFQLPAALMRELETYQTSAFMIGLTIGPDNVLAYVNDAGRRMFGIAPESETLERFQTRRTSAGTNAFREAAKRAYATGRPATIENQPARWLRDDGTWASGHFSCVLQPVREATGEMFGVLWICTPVIEPSETRSD
jgi:PAS domain-containing protein